MKNIFAENLKKLRKLTGLTQSELAQELNKFALKCGIAKDGVEVFGKGKKKILNLENGNQEPTLSDIEIISKYFYINSDDLMFDTSIIDSIKGVENLQLEHFIMLPVFSSDSIGDLFRKAYDKHCSILKQFNKGDEQNLKDCLMDYIISWEEEHDIKSIANYMSLLIFEACINFFKELRIDKELNLEVQKLSLKSSFGVVLNRDVAKKENKRKYLNNDYIENYKKILKENGFIEFVEYFKAVSYLLGFIDNSNRDFLNEQMGFEMLRMLANQGNRYAFLVISALLIDNIDQENDDIDQETNEDVFDEFDEEGIMVYFL